MPAIRAIGERMIEEKSPLVTINEVPIIANKIEIRIVLVKIFTCKKSSTRVHF